MSTLMTPMGVLSFPHLFTPKAPAVGAKPRYSMNLVFTKEQQSDPAYAKMRQAIVDTAREKFGAKADDMLKSGAIRSPLRRSQDKDYAGYADVEGGMFAAFWSDSRPGLVGPDLEDIINESDAYAGAIARATYRPFAYDTSGNKGVSFGLVNVQICDMTTPRLDGRKAAKDEFEALEGAATSSAGVDEDELPF